VVSRPHIGLAFKALYVSRALNSFLAAQLLNISSGIDTYDTLKEGGQGTLKSATKERVPLYLTKAARSAILKERARQDYGKRKGR